MYSGYYMEVLFCNKGGGAKKREKSVQYYLAKAKERKNILAGSTVCGVSVIRVFLVISILAVFVQCILKICFQTISKSLNFTKEK